MSTVINIPRFAAKNLSIKPKNCIWISISEPKDLSTVISNNSLDELPKLHLSFWDLTQVIEHDGEMLYPPSPTVAKAIVDFLLSHRGKNVIVNCAAGVSRSGAVAQFCADFLGYGWMEEGKRCACPNPVLYGLMRDYYLSLEYGKQHGPTPLLTAYEKSIKSLTDPHFKDTLIS